MIRILEDIDTSDDVIYTFIGDIEVYKYMYDEQEEERMPNVDAVQYKSEIDNAITNSFNGTENLASYIGSARELETVKRIDISTTVSDRILKSVATCTCSRELSNKEINKLREYIENQYSDGWGERFEKTPIDEYYEEYKVSSEDTDEDIEGTQRIEVFVHFWNSYMELELVE